MCRPARDSLYLQIGVSENDAEEQGLSQLDTELAMTDLGRTANSSAVNNQQCGGGVGGVPRGPPPASARGGGLPVSTGAGTKPNSNGQQKQPARFTISDED
jgi:hypothetical protein